MKILLVGAGGREHALAWKIAQSPLLSKLYCAPGNPGIEHLDHEIQGCSKDGVGPRVSCVAITDGEIKALTAFAAEKQIDLVVVGPEAPLAAGLSDALGALGIACFGPSKAAAQLESSKGYVKDLCTAYAIPTARYGRFKTPDTAISFLDTLPPPYVIKADGLAAGKGVIIAQSRPEAEAAIHEMLEGQFGTASEQIVIEEFLEGEEVSFFALCDGTHLLPLLAAQDHKRAYDDDQGPNTGGMGAYAPAPIFTATLRQQVIDTILRPTITAMKDRHTPYVGVLYAGLMITKDGPKLIEYNARFGDPECQILMRLLQSDIVPALKAAAEGKLAGIELDWSQEVAALVVLAANGYPYTYEKGTEIKNLDSACALPGIEIFHAGTKKAGERVLANGGRVLNVTALASSGHEAIKSAYAAVEKVDWSDGFYRRDIGWRLLAHEANGK